MNAAPRSDLGGTCVTAALACMLLMALPNNAAAQETWKFLGGAAAALGMHEGGHVIMDEVFGASPGLKKVSFGPFPFFAITHQPVPPAREFAISSAGFWVQHATDEVILSRSPYVRESRAPWIRGMLAFNVLTSVAYAGAAFARTGPAERDTRGMAVSADVAEPVVGALVLAPAVFDAVRYYRPRAKWAAWASRAAKIGGALLIIEAGSR